VIAVLLFLIGLLIGALCGYVFRMAREEYLFRAEERKLGEYQIDYGSEPDQWCPHRHKHNAGCYK